MKRQSLSKTHNPSSGARGFTLIELLVVIAIIAILAAILFPVFARARENARRTSCLSNMKQIGLGVMQYSQDYDEKYPLGFRNSNGFSTWFLDTVPYVKSVEVFRCPSDPIGTGQEPWAGPRISYAGNGYLRPRAADGEWEFGGIINPEENWGGGKPFKNIRSLSEVNRPAQSIMVSERAHVYPNASSTRGNSAWYGRGCCFTGVPWWDSDAPGNIPDGKRAASTNPYDSNGPNGGVMPIHLETANFLFADGHAKAMRPTATNPDPVGRPEDNMWDSLRP